MEVSARHWDMNACERGTTRQTERAPTKNWRKVCAQRDLYANDNKKNVRERDEFGVGNRSGNLYAREVWSPKNGMDVQGTKWRTSLETKNAICRKGIYRFYVAGFVSTIIVQLDFLSFSFVYKKPTVVDYCYFKKKRRKVNVL